MFAMFLQSNVRAHTGQSFQIGQRATLIGERPVMSMNDRSLYRRKPPTPCVLYPINEAMKKKVLNCIVVDDDRATREIIKQCVKITDFLHWVGSYESALEARSEMRKAQVDLIFLDVEMPNMSGLDFVKTFRDLPPVILITSKKEYAFEAFENDVVDFLAKPVVYARFLKAAEKALRQHQTSRQTEGTPLKKTHIFVKTDQTALKVWLEEIWHVESFGDYVKIHTTSERLTVLSTLKALLDELPAEQFMQVHRSHVVNLSKVTRIEAGTTLFMDTYKVPISRSFKDEVKQRVGLFEGGK